LPTTGPDVLFSKKGRGREVESESERESDVSVRYKVLERDGGG